MFGLETEYAISWIKGHKSPDRELLTNHFMEAARKCLLHLPDIQSSGMFLANGSRLYIDCGQHPELATPECTNPWDAVRYLKAGERIINTVMEQLRLDLKTDAEIFCTSCNVDYLQNTTWGCHESYLHRCDVHALSKHIIPHLVSRTIFVGTGGFEPHAAGLRFTLSPRASHISHVVSSDSTGERGIYHTKDESLSGRGYHRLHILCGESQRSESSIFLKISTTAIVVAMIEAGLKPCDDLELASPVDALHTVAADTHCQERLELVGGRTASALEIQRHYLSLAELHRNDSFMPPWTEDICWRWRQVLDLLEENPSKTHKMLDWTIKQKLYSHHLEKRGAQWEKIQAWSKIIDALQAALNESTRYNLLSPDVILGPNSPVLETVAQLTAHIRENRLRWDGLGDFLQLKQEMFEIDTRFGQLGEKSVFQSLDRTGMLAHHVEGVDNIEQAMSHPPSTGRARLRGEMVRRLADQGSKYRCTWQFISDNEKRPILDLSDPFVAGEDPPSNTGCNKHHDRQRDLPFGNDVDPLLSPFLRVRGRSAGAR
jgi:proteasome accessory factor A